MGKLQELNGGACSFLQPEHLIGRGDRCVLRLERAYVSTQHALVRWNGDSWELVDRGSRNGTFLNGVAVESGKAHILTPRAVLAFGHLQERWQLVDVDAPQVCVVGVGTDVQLLGSDGVIGVPSDLDPQCTVYRDTDGLWKLEKVDSPAFRIDDGYTWELSDQSWRFCSPQLTSSTVTSELSAGPSASTLCFAVSQDEEFVELTVECANRRICLGARTHNYLLLVLARARFNDRATRLPETSCGWVYKEQLADDLRITPQQVDGEVFRIRKHFAAHGLEDAATIIERRTRTKQLRLGTTRVRIDRR